MNFPVVIGSLMFICPFIISFFTGKIKSKKKPVIVLATLQRLAWLLVTVMVILFIGNPALMIPAFLISFALFQIFIGSVGLFWQEMMGRSCYRRDEAVQWA